MNRCKWVNIDNELYVKYHDDVWGVECHDDTMLFKYLVLEMFQAGLNWETIINKEKYFCEAFDNFDYKTIINYDDKKIEDNIAIDDVVISMGYSVLQPEDGLLHDVFERADQMMYQRKKELKEMGASTRNG